MDVVELSHVVSGLALAVTFGGMTFFSAVMAPLIFTKLPFDTAGAFIRQVFPWYYLAMGVATLVALVSLIVGSSHLGGWQAGVTALVLIGFVYARQILMPQINDARDTEINGNREAGQRFQRLHRLSVVINGVQWFGALAVLIGILA